MTYHDMYHRVGRMHSTLPCARKTSPREDCGVSNYVPVAFTQFPS